MSYASTIEGFLERFSRVKSIGSNKWQALCPAHSDHEPSLHIKISDDSKILINCKAGCFPNAIVQAVGLTMSDLYLNRPEYSSKPRGEIVKTYPYHGEDGNMLFEVVRYRPKGFAQRQPDGNGGWKWGLGGISPVVYHLPEVKAAIDKGQAVYILEGEKDADNLRALGATATCNPSGALKWRGSYTDQLSGLTEARILPDNDPPGRKHARQVATSLYEAGIASKILEMPDETIKDATDWITQGLTLEALERLFSDTPLWGPQKATIDEVIALFEQHFHLEDPGLIKILYGTIAANMGPGDPVWNLIVGPPGAGKTEPIAAASNVSHVHQVAVLTEASLLSGTPRKDMPHGAKGGLLAEMSNFGIIAIKDFSGMLTMHRDARGPILAALREIYDGEWTRWVGVDGGRKLHWKGKCGLIGAATPSIDQHYQVMATLGERFTFYRYEPKEVDKLAAMALGQAGHEDEIRPSLKEAVKALFENVQPSQEIPIYDKAQQDRLVALANLTTRCRSPVERDPYQGREILLVGGAETPTRIAKTLGTLLRGLKDIGVTPECAWDLITKVSIDSMPKLRQKILLEMIKNGGASEWKVTDVAINLGYPTTTTRRALEDMACYEIVGRTSRGEGIYDTWALTKWTIETYKAATKKLTLPETWEPHINAFSLYKTPTHKTPNIGHGTSNSEKADLVPYPVPQEDMIPSADALGMLEDYLGMKRDEVISLWKKAGSPQVLMDNDRVCFDLEAELRKPQIGLMGLGAIADFVRDLWKKGGAP